MLSTEQFERDLADLTPGQFEQLVHAVVLKVPIRIHSTDTAGYSDIIFALFDLLGLQFAPRLAGLPDTRLWLAGPAHDSPAGRLLKNRLKLDLIHRQWMSCCASPDRLTRGP